MGEVQVIKQVFGKIPQIKQSLFRLKHEINIGDYLTHNTQIGRGIHRAKIAVKNKLQKLEQSVGEKFSLEKMIKTNSGKAYYNLRKDKEFMTLWREHANARGLKNISHADLRDPKVLQEFIERSGVGTTKLAQIVSVDEAIMGKIAAQNPALAEAIAKTKSHCSFSRTLEEAQVILDHSFPNQSLKIVKELSAGSIGAAYVIQKPDGTKCVLKMIKDGVTKSGLEREEKLCKRIIDELADTPSEAEKLKYKMEQYYKGWAEELDFGAEYTNNKILAKGAKRYKVADISDLSADGKCIIMDFASGIQMNRLVEILKDYKLNPEGFARKYAKEIAENPWLGNPEKVIQELQTTLLKTFDEQFMFMKNGKSLMHGDPHTGNFFITADKKGHLIPEFIDTGNCVMRSGTEITKDIEFFTNYFVGNTEGIAKYFIEQCGYQGANKAALVKQIGNVIKDEIFAVPQNITNFQGVQENIQIILKRYGLEMSAKNATALKAQMQFFTAISQAGSLKGSGGLNMGTIIADIPQASFRMIKSGENPFKALKSAINYFIRNKEVAVGTAYQFKADSRAMKEVLGDIQEVGMMA